MKRAIVTLLLLGAGITSGQEQDPEVRNQPPSQTDILLKQLVEEMIQLRRTVTDQTRKIADLEKTIKTMQAAPAAVPRRIPPTTPLWQSASNWALIRKGMSEADVVEILGPPARVESVIDTRKLYYQPEPGSTFKLRGFITLIDDRLTASVPPEF